MYDKIHYNIKNKKILKKLKEKKELKEVEINNVPDKEFKTVTVKKLLKLGRKWMKSAALANTKKNQTEMKTPITEMKNTLEKNQQ